MAASQSPKLLVAVRVRTGRPNFKLDLYSSICYNISSVYDLGNNMHALSQVSSPMFLIPAYGRSYKTKEQVLEAWKSGKDFKIDGGPYCSIRDIDFMHKQFQNIYILYDMGTVQV